MTHRHHNGHHHDHDRHHDHAHGGLGHNHPHSHKSAAQWQTPHQPEAAESATAPEPDLDKVETAFVDGFLGAPDAISFLRLARVPFEFTAMDGSNLKLLRVEIDALTDVGSLTPHVGGESFRYDPLPANFVSQRRRLRFVYFDGANLRPLTFSELRAHV
jgi:hypothetical protein